MGTLLKVSNDRWMHAYQGLGGPEARRFVAKSFATPATAEATEAQGVSELGQVSAESRATHRDSLSLNPEVGFQGSL